MYGMFKRYARVVPRLSFKRFSAVVNECQSLIFAVLEAYQFSSGDGFDPAMCHFIVVEARQPVFQRGVSIHAKHRRDDTVGSTPIRSSLWPIEEGDVGTGCTEFVR